MLSHASPGLFSDCPWSRTNGGFGHSLPAMAKLQETWGAFAHWRMEHDGTILLQIRLVLGRIWSDFLSNCVSCPLLPSYRQLHHTQRHRYAVQLSPVVG